MPYMIVDASQRGRILYKYADLIERDREYLALSFIVIHALHDCCFCLFDLILYVPSTIFQLYRDGSSWVEPVLS